MKFISIPRADLLNMFPELNSFSICLLNFPSIYEIKATTKSVECYCKKKIKTHIPSHLNISFSFTFFTRLHSKPLYITYKLGPKILFHFVCVFIKSFSGPFNKTSFSTRNFTQILKTMNSCIEPSFFLVISSNQTCEFNPLNLANFFY